MTYAKQLTLNMEWLWSFIIRARDGFCCQLHGMDAIKCGGGLQAAHLVTRGVKGTKFVLINGKCLCQAHHKYYTHRPEHWATIAQKLWPEEWNYVTKKKWLETSYGLDREQEFVGLMLEAQACIYNYPEYLPKLQRISDWVTKVAEGK
jgi:hypothetical protein